jgi:hypothetical protein
MDCPTNESRIQAMTLPGEIFHVSRRGRAPLLEFILGALRESGCSIIQQSADDEAPFRVSFATPWGERTGIVAYAFTANSIRTRNRPDDEHRFQVKYGSKDGLLHTLWQDPFGLYTTLFLGINAQAGFFVGADPVLNSPTRFFISKEFKQEHVDAILMSGWHAWERPRRRDLAGEPIEVLVGGTRENFLRYVLFEREARGEEQGPRQLVAEQYASASLRAGLLLAGGDDAVSKSAVAQRGDRAVLPPQIHRLEREFDLGAPEILELIAGAPRLKMAVRGWVAERHLHAVLESLPSVASVEAIEQDGQPDFRVEMRRGRKPLLIECKNVLRTTDRNGHARMDFMRTRASPAHPCSRYYSPTEFDVLAACLHASTERWDFAARRTVELAPHRRCTGRLDNRLVIDEGWERDLSDVLVRAANAA